MIINKVICKNSLFNMVSMLEIQKEMKRILAGEELRFACRLCEVYCTVQHSRSRNIIKTYLKENPQPPAGSE